MRGTINGFSHYWNYFPELNRALDLTADQFPKYPREFELTGPRSREYVLSFPDTKRRYELLKARVNGIKE